MSNFQGGAGTAWYLLDTTKAIKPFILQVRRDYAFVSKTAVADDNVFMGNEFVYGVDGRLNVGYGLWQLAYASKQTLDMTNYAAARASMMSVKSDGGKTAERHAQRAAGAAEPGKGRAGHGAGRAPGQRCHQHLPKHRPRGGGAPGWP